MSFCGKCGKEVKEGGKFCGSCGAPVETGASAPTGKEEVSGGGRATRVTRKKTWSIPLLKFFGALISAVIIAVIVVSLFKTGEAKETIGDAPRKLASFEAAYLAAVAEKGFDAGFAENDLVFFKLPADSKLFKYEYVTYAQGGIVGLKATALSDIGEFAKGGFLQTVYYNDSETFTHCVGGNRSAVGVAGELLPHFNASGVDCGSVEIKNVRASAPASTQQNNTFTDKRDGKTYRTVKIGKQTWMAENLNYKTGESVCYDDDNANCLKYGRLYDWNDAKKACPTGWHLPSDAEWDVLMVAVGGEKHEYRDGNDYSERWEKASKKLKSKTGWNKSSNGTDDYGFSALPSGRHFYDVGNFEDVGDNGYWWSATEVDDDFAYLRDISVYESVISRELRNDFQFSVRCVQD